MPPEVKDWSFNMANQISMNRVRKPDAVPEEKQFDERTLHFDRVARVVKGGRRFRCRVERCERRLLERRATDHCGEGNPPRNCCGRDIDGFRTRKIGESLHPLQA